MKYFDVYFRIKSKYKHDQGWNNEEDKTTFYNEVLSLFKNAGWTMEQSSVSGACMTVHNGKSDLYLHPMNFSGTVESELIEQVEKILSNGAIFECYHTDLYEEVFDMLDDEYMNYLVSNKENIKIDLLQSFKTKRKNLYVSDVDAVIQHVKKKYGIKRLSGTKNMEWKYVGDVLKEMIEDDCFVSAKTKYGTGYRTAS